MLKPIFGIKKKIVGPELITEDWYESAWKNTYIFFLLRNKAREDESNNSRISVDDDGPVNVKSNNNKAKDKLVWYDKRLKCLSFEIIHS